MRRGWKYLSYDSFARVSYAQSGIFALSAAGQCWPTLFGCSLFNTLAVPRFRLRGAAFFFAAHL